MKRILLIVTVLMIASACSLSWQPAAPSPVASVTLPAPLSPTATLSDAELSLAEWGDPQPYQPGLVTSQQGALALLATANEYHISLSIAEDLQSISAHQDMRLTNNENTTLTQLYFHLFPNYSGGEITISNPQVSGQSVPVEIQADATILALSLPQPLKPGESLPVSMDFTLTIPTEMGGNYGLFGYFDNVLVLDTFYPMLAVYDEHGWHAEKPMPNGDLTYTDASFYLVTVDAPADLTLAASGIALQRSTQNQRQQVTFAAGPARDFYLAGSAAYQQWSRQVGEVTVNSYALPQNEEAAQLALDSAASAIEIYSRRFAPYPYTEFDVISSPMRALGIEYPGITGIAMGVYDFSKVDKQVLEGTVAHETAHQWFYNLVGNDQSNQPWVDESVTQYATSLYYLDLYNNAAAISYRSSWDSRWQRVNREAIPIGLPAGDYAGDAYSPIVYGRGPLFLAALEKEMGKQPFAAFLKAYVAEYTWQNADTEGFRAAAEAACQCDLGALFAEWVYSPPQ